MERYCDLADADAAEKPAHPVSDVNAVPSQMLVDIQLDLLRLDYGLGPEMAVSSPQED
jgi:hypothetical protein